jgi:hypothetical protein
MSVTVLFKSWQIEVLLSGNHNKSAKTLVCNEKCLLHFWFGFEKSDYSFVEMDV